MLGKALKGERRESLEILTKVYWPTGPRGHNDVGLSRKHIMESINGSLSGRIRPCRSLSGLSLRPRHSARGDQCRRSLTGAQGKVLYVGVSEWTAEQIQDGHDLAEDLGIQLISNQPQYSMLWRVIEADVTPLSISLGVSQIVFSPIAQGCSPGSTDRVNSPPAGSRATDEKGGADMIKRVDERRRPEASPAARTTRQGSRTVHGAAGVAWVLQNGNVASAIIGASRPEQVHDNVAAAGVKLEDDLLNKIDEVLDPVVQRDPAKTLENSPKTR